MHSADTLIQLFNQLFSHTENTILIGDAEEPLYQPSNTPDIPHQLFFTQDYFSSALHEISHWTLAGQERRQQVDYGYWYAPDGRTAEQQLEFEKVEIKPQAIEWLFSLASGIKFNISADNLDAGLGASPGFKQAVWKQATQYLEEDNLPDRAKIFLNSLVNHFQSKTELKAELLDINRL